MAHDSLIGKKLANFRIERTLGQGGMAIVYLGTDTQLDRPVAIKLINPQFQADPAYASRFVSEAKIVARWRHENIIAVYYADNSDGLYYFVMEYIDGATLSDLLVRYLQDGELMPHEDVIKIARAVASGLDYAHQQGVVHRDIKPSNIMISREDRVVLTDFGLALDMAQGSMGEIFGTPHYVAPEQVRRSSDANPQSDIYSFGIVLYEMLTGALPFDDPSAMAIAMQHLSDPPPRPLDLNPALNKATEDVLLKAIEKEPSERYPTATEFIDELEEALAKIGKERATAPDIMPPAAVMQGGRAPKQLSRVSILDMVAMEVQGKAATSIAQPTNVADKVAKAPKPVTLEKEKNGGSNNTMLFAGIGVIALVIIIALVAIIAFGGNSDNTDAEALALNETQTQEAIVLAQAPTAEPASATPEPLPTETSAPTEIAITVFPTDNFEASATAIQLTNDVIATSNSVTIEALTQDASAQFAVQTQAAQAIVLTQNAVPTERFPSGRLIEMTYNSGGFYLQNRGGSRIRDSRLSFLAVNSGGAAVSQTFDGVDWAIGYNSVDNNLCVRIELLDQASWSRPNSCGSYNSALTFPTNDGRIFWTGANGATHFIVLWDDTETGRCEIATGFCQVRVGSE